MNFSFLFPLVTSMTLAFQSANAPLTHDSSSRFGRAFVGAVVDLQFSPDGTRLAAAHWVGANDRGGFRWDARVIQWDLTTREFTVIRNGFAPIAFIDNDQLVMGSYSRQPRDNRPHTRLALWTFGELDPLALFEPNADETSFSNMPLAVVTTTSDELVISINRAGHVVSWSVGLQPTLIESLPGFPRLSHTTFGIDDNGLLHFVPSSEIRKRSLRPVPVAATWVRDQGRWVRFESADASPHPIVKSIRALTRINFAEQPEVEKGSLPSLTQWAELKSYPANQFASSDNWFAATIENRVVVIDRLSGTRSASLGPARGAFAFSSDGRHIAYTDDVGIIYLYSIADSKLIARLRVDEPPIEEQE